jgi:tRNA pseudouridine13 synthase
MKIKGKPEDFIVDEMTDILPLKGGEFGLFLLEKRGWNTADLLRRLSRELRIPFSDFSYGGRKDRHALTRQYITVRRQRMQGRELERIEVREADYSLEFLGYSERPMGPDLIGGNRFAITMRDMTGEEVRSALRGIETVGKIGYPNYFDDQRFGSFDTRQGFIAEKILKGHYNGALKVYLTHIRAADKGADKERRRFFFEHWGDWRACLERAKTFPEQDAFGILVKDPKAFVPALQKISGEEMSLFFSAYQSFLWNELLRRVVREKAPMLNFSPGVAGDYLFYTDLAQEAFAYLMELAIPAPASGSTMPDAFTQSLYADILGERGIRPPLFNTRKIRQAFFKATERRAVVIPDELSWESSSDELHRDRQKTVLKFLLPRGSYATMFIKRLFSGRCEEGFP